MPDIIADFLAPNEYKYAKGIRNMQLNMAFISCIGKLLSPNLKSNRNLKILGLES